MRKKRTLSIIGIIFAALGLISFALCFFQQGWNGGLLSSGFLCNSVAFLLYCIGNRRN